MNPNQSGKASVRVLALIFAFFALFAVMFSVLASPPQWWQIRGVINTNANVVTNDFAPATQGQLKWLATKAAEELDNSIPGGAGASVHALISGFSTSNNYAPVLIGQLKAVATNFYDRLIAIGYTNAYPWAASTNTPNDFAPVTIGQLKNLFSFDLRGGADSDGDGMPDWWEIKYGLSPNSALDAHADADGDGIDNLMEYQSKTDPTSADPVIDATADATIQFRTVASSRSFASEGVMGFQNCNRCFRSVTLSASASWDIKTNYNCGMSNGFEDTIDKGDVAPVNIMANFKTNMDCEAYWEVHGATLGAYHEQHDYDTNHVCTSSSYSSVFWTWDVFGTLDSVTWQVGGASATVTCMSATGQTATNSTALPPGTNSPCAPPYIVITGDGYADTDIHKKWDWNSYSAASCCGDVIDHLPESREGGTVEVTLGDELTIDELEAMVRADVADTNAMAAASWGGDPLWIKQCGDDLCGGGVAGLLKTATKASAKRGEYRFMLANTCSGVYYRVLAGEKDTSFSPTVARGPMQFFARGTGGAVYFTPTNSVDVPAAPGCVFASPLFVKLQNYTDCWKTNWVVSLAPEMQMSTDGMTSNDVIWSIGLLEGPGGASLDPNCNNIFLFGGGGGKYLVTARSKLFDSVCGCATLTVVKVDFAQPASVIAWTPGGTINAASSLANDCYPPADRLTFTASTVSGSPLVNSGNGNYTLPEDSGGEYNLSVSSSYCESVKNIKAQRVILERQNEVSLVWLSVRGINQNTNILVGQKMILRVRTDPPLTGNITWDIGSLSDTFLNYTADAYQAIIVSNNTPCTSETNEFYWSVLTDTSTKTKSVHITVTVTDSSGKQFSDSADMQVFRPDFTTNVFLDPLVQIISTSTSAVDATGRGAMKSQSYTFDGNVTKPSIFSGDDDAVAVYQVVKHNQRFGYSNGSTTVLKNASFYWDGRRTEHGLLPATEPDFPVSGSNSERDGRGGWNFQFSDNPATKEIHSSEGYRTVEVLNDDLITFLMYKPPGASSCYVPLCHAEWQWNCNMRFGETTSGPTWYWFDLTVPNKFVPGHGQIVSHSDTAAFPTWTDYIGNQEGETNE